MSKQGGSGGGTSGGNIYANAANALGQAGGAFGDALSAYGNPNTGSYKPATTGLPANIASGIDTYMNPYTESVIDNAISDQDRLTALQQQRNAAAATNAGAFGGDRHALVEATTNSEAQRNLGALTGGLRSAGFNTAAGLSAQDIANQMTTGQFNANAKNTASQFNEGNEMAKAAGLGNIGALLQNLGLSGFGIGQQIQGQQQQQGAQQQNLVQGIMNLASGQYGQYTGSPGQALATLLSGTSGNPLAGAGTTTGTTTPGLFDWMSLIGQTIAGVKGGPQ